MTNYKDQFKDLIQKVKKNDVEKLNETASATVTMTGDTASDVVELSKMFSNAGIEQPKTTNTLPNEDYANEPDEEYQDADYMVHDLSGGINNNKTMSPPAAMGDNPLAVEDTDDTDEDDQYESIKNILYAKLSEKLGTKDNEEKFSGYSKGDNKKDHPDKDKLVGEESEEKESEDKKDKDDVSEGRREMDSILALSESINSAQTTTNSSYSTDLKKLAGI